jgi:hypothetical protein
MRPCRKYKEPIALSLVEGALGDDLKQHISECAECAGYAEELKRVCSEHRERATQLPEVEAPMRLRARVRDAIVRGEYDSCCGFEIGVSLRRLLQGAGVAATATVVALVVRFSSGEPPITPTVTEVPAPGLSEEARLNEPTLAAYHRRLARSVEELEASLKEHGAVTGGELLKVSSLSEHLQ